MELVNIIIDDRTQALETQSFNRVLVVDVTKPINYQETDQVSGFVGINPEDVAYDRVSNILQQNIQSVALFGFNATVANVAEYMETLDLTRFMHINIATLDKDLFKAFAEWCGANKKFINFTPAIADGVVVADDAEAIDMAEQLALDVNSANAILLMHRGTIDIYENARKATDEVFTEGSSTPDVYQFTTNDVDRANYDKQILVVEIQTTNLNAVEIRLDSDLEALPVKKVVLGSVVDLEPGDFEVGRKYVLKSIKTPTSFYWVVVEEYSPAEQYDLASGYIGQFAPLDVGSTTGAFKQVNGVPVNYYSKPNQARAEATNKLNWIQPHAGATLVMDGKTTFGTYFDNEVGKVWLEAKLQEALGALLVRTNRYAKLPFTLDGKALIDTTIREVVRLAETQGFLVPGTTTIEIPNPNQLPVNDKGNRVWAGIKVSSTIQGAVHQLRITYVLSL